MTVDELKSLVDPLIRKAKLEEVFILLDKHISKKSKFGDDLLVIQGRFENNRRTANLGTTPDNLINMEVNAISKSVLDTLRMLQNEDIAEPILDVKNSRILIICRNNSDEFYMRAFCGRMGIPNYDVKQLKEYEEPTEYDFIIFDNHSIKEIENEFELSSDEIAHLKLMTEYIEEFSEHKKYMIHFGEMINVVSKNRDVIYAGNSKFALFSRIQEMIQYIGKDRLYKTPPSV